MATRPNHINSVLKAVALIDALAQSPQERTLTALANETGQPVPTTHRLLMTLEHAGWLTRNSKGYLLSLRMAEIAGNVLTNLDVRTEALGPMQELTKATGETSYLGVREGDLVMCVERLESMDMVRVMTWDVGKTNPLRVGGAGLALLAFLSDDEAARIIAATPVEAVYPHASSDEALLASFEEIRTHGYAVSSEEIIPGIASVGAPVLDQNGRLAAAISVGGLTPRILGALDTVTSATLAAAETVSRSLKYTGAYPPAWPLSGS